MLWSVLHLLLLLPRIPTLHLLVPVIHHRDRRNKPGRGRAVRGSLSSTPKAWLLVGWLLNLTMKRTTRIGIVAFMRMVILLMLVLMLLVWQGITMQSL